MNIFFIVLTDHLIKFRLKFKWGFTFNLEIWIYRINSHLAHTRDSAITIIAILLEQALFEEHFINYFLRNAEKYSDLSISSNTKFNDKK